MHGTEKTFKKKLRKGGYKNNGNKKQERIVLEMKNMITEIHT